jgi:hypothetical protein
MRAISWLHDCWGSEAAGCGCAETQAGRLWRRGRIAGEPFQALARLSNTKHLVQGALQVKLIITLVIIAICAMLFRRWHEARDPEVITNPVYAEAHITLGVQNRDIELVLLDQTANQDECAKAQGTLENAYGARAGKPGQQWEIKSLECKTELDPRYTLLFDNQPVAATYESMARGSRHEREMRMIAWGVTVDESDKICDLLAANDRGRRQGEVKCVRAAR